MSRNELKNIKVTHP